MSGPGFAVDEDVIEKDQHKFPQIGLKHIIH